MDNALLIPVADEIRASLVGSTLGDVVQIDSRRFALRFSTPPFLRICVALHPDLSAIYMARRVPTPREPTELATVITERLQEAVLSAVIKEPAERIVELHFEGGPSGRASVVLELLGKASNILLLDGDRTIVRFARSHSGSFRQPREGARYVPPPGRAETELPLGSRLLELEVATLAACGEPEGSARARIVERIRTARWAPCLYAPRPPEEIPEGEPLSSKSCFAAPFPLEAGAGLVRTDFETACEAASVHAELMLRHLLFRDLRGSLLSLVNAESSRTGKLISTLEREANEARGAGELRRRGELILASVGSARKDGDAVEVTDYYDADLPKVRLPLDPRLDLKGNAEALFRRARKQERAASVIASRAAEARGRLESLGSLASRLSGSATTAELESLEAEISRTGLVKAVRRPGRRELGRRPSYVQVREYRTKDGCVILVGRSGAENDTLTFKVAAPHDFWLHAAGRAGAHVIVRNPRRLRELPESTLMTAAAIAAWYSKGDKAEEMDVHYAQRKEVRKGKGMSPGMVMLRSHRTVRVKPALPSGDHHAPEEGGSSSRDR
jgi:predicted ribosome quality control (RQC) complex YloA/Tae2 family protein